MEGMRAKLTKVVYKSERYISRGSSTFVNLARIPSISVPAGYTKKDKMPIGMQFAGKMFNEGFILKVAQSWENDHNNCGIQLQ